MWKALPLAAAAIVLTATAAGGSIMRPGGHAASGAFEVSQTLGKGDQLRLVVSDQGSSATETRNKTRSGVVVRYEDSQVFALDYATKSYSTQSVAATAKDLKRERNLVDKMQIEVAARDGSNHAVLHYPTLTPLELEDKIAGQPAHAFAFHQEGVKTPVRVWYADDLPAPPEEIQKQVAGAVPMPLSSRRVLLRTETQLKGRWITGLDTIAVKEIEVTRETFAPPAGWREVKAPKLRAPAGIPARPLRWVGPISSAPDVFALYWNGPFSASFISSTNSLLASMVTPPSAYWAPMGQYGVGAGRFIGSSTIAYPMPITVGSWNFFIVEGMLIQSYFTTGAPKIWWRFGRDPIISVNVSSAAVISGGWGGYHMVNVSLQALLPWPVSLSAHPEMPWFITKAAPITGPPNGTTTTTLSHELVETASDPLPLSANIDYTKSPPWTGGELADICSVLPPLPPSSTIFRFGATLARYWSNSAGACVG
jgi:hypothetical protein